MKCLFVFLTLTFALNSFSQSKKEQIVMLNFRLDSAQREYVKDTAQLGRVVKKLEKEILVLKNKNDAAQEQIKKKSQGIRDKTETIITLNASNLELMQERKQLQKEINILRDSLKRNLQKVDTINLKIKDLYWNQVEFDLNLILPINIFDANSLVDNDPPNHNWRKYAGFTGYSLVSRDNKVKIEVFYNYTHWSDYQDRGTELFYKQQDVVDYFTQGLNDVSVSLNDGFSIKGKNNRNKFIFIRGLYGELSSMQGRDEGEPMWLWSNTIMLKVTAEETESLNFNYIADLLHYNFNYNSIY
jgi:hypothetical protein